MNGSESTHVKAVDILVRRFADDDLKEYGSPIEKNPWLCQRVVGGTKAGYAHVFVE